MPGHQNSGAPYVTDCLTVALIPNGMSQVFQVADKILVRQAGGHQNSDLRGSCTVVNSAAGAQDKKSIFFRLDMICEVNQPVGRMEAS